jgi:small subunit ribosomal protein S21
MGFELAERRQSRFLERYCRGGIRLTQVQVRPNESLDSALKRFKKQLQQTGVLKEAREHEHYEKPSDKKRKAEAAARRKRIRNEEKEKS